MLLLLPNLIPPSQNFRASSATLPSPCIGAILHLGAFCRPRLPPPDHPRHGQPPSEKQSKVAQAHQTLPAREEAVAPEAQEGASAQRPRGAATRMGQEEDGVPEVRLGEGSGGWIGLTAYLVTPRWACCHRYLCLKAHPARNRIEPRSIFRAKTLLRRLSGMEGSSGMTRGT